MRRATCLVVGLVALAGCGPEKTLPDKVNLTPELPPVVILPTQSDPAAVAVVNRALAKATEGHPERISKAKAFRLSLKGVVIRYGVEVATLRKVEAVWPDRLVQRDEYNAQGATELVIGLRRPVVWVRKRVNGQLQADESPADQEKYASAQARDAIGRYWLPTLVPLADPDAIVFGAKTEMVNGESCDVIKMAISGSPVYTLWFGERSGYLGQIDFTHVEPGGSVAKSFALSQHKAVGGIVVPMQIGYLHNGVKVENWTVDSWEFVDSIPEATFAPPK